ncbi:MAG TPA: SpoIID/LytB domain-containing protein [Syntrophorhabdaceae bacterium]|nr:SpoIID/LytB domain-containing protein [Syntrophorhabdaceae bacterium]
MNGIFFGHNCDVLRNIDTRDEIVKWYEQEDHDLYDVCADDHCQRYQGTTKVLSSRPVEAVQKTRGRVLIHNGEICDARFSKSCGGITEEFSTAWETKSVPYLTSISDSPVQYHAVVTEEDAVHWIRSEPDAYCNTVDEKLIEHILPGFDRETKSWFRWHVEYGREELEEILTESTQIDFGKLIEINPLSRGPSGRIFRLEIVGTKKRMIIGKELEIRRCLSRTHLFSSAFYVTRECDEDGSVRRFIFRGAGWGHGVGLCQIGAAVMASKGYSAEYILAHYFPGTQVYVIY